MRYMSRQGNFGLGKAIGFYTSQGWIVCIPLNDTQGFDLIVEKHGCIKRVQVKTTAYKKNTDNYYVNLASSKAHDSRFDKYSCDVLFIVTIDEKMYEIPSEIINNTHQLALTDKYNIFLQDYTDFKTFVETD